MMLAFKFNTLTFARKLAEAGLTRDAAEAIANGLAEIDTSDLATKQDLQIVANQITIRLGGIVIACTGAAIGVVTVLQHLS